MKSLITTILLLLNLSIAGQDSKQLIFISTGLGEILIELYPEKAPVTVSNFLDYVKGGYFENSGFYRTVTLDNQPGNKIKIEVIQGGLSGTGKKPGIAAIEHETTGSTGLKHLDGTISMARSDPGSATSEFFICINDQPSLDYGGMRNPDGQGFAAFGKVIRGMEVIREIHQSPCEGQNLMPVVEIKNIWTGIWREKKTGLDLNNEEGQY